MVKKFLTIVLLFCYTLATAGVSINYFYCCGKLKSVSFVEKKKAARCGMKKKMKRCCENKKVTLQLKADQKHSEFKTFQFASEFGTAALPSYGMWLNHPVAISVYHNKLQQRPPPYNLTPLHIRHCVFLI